MPSSRTPRPEESAEEQNYCPHYLIPSKTWRVTVVLIMTFFGASLLLLLVWGVTSNLMDNGNETELQGLRNANKDLHTRLEALERKLNVAGEMIDEVQSDCNYYARHHHTPRVETDVIQLRVEDWVTKLKKVEDLQNEAKISFRAGGKLGPSFHTGWTLYLSSTPTTKGVGGGGSGGMNVHIALDERGTGGDDLDDISLWAAFSVQALYPNGTVAVSRSHPVTNVMDNLVVGSGSGSNGNAEGWPEMVIHNFMTLTDVSHLLVNGSLTIHAKLKLFGQGYRLYESKMVTHPQRDTQKVIFAVDMSKPTGNSSSPRNSSSNTTSKPLAYSTFELSHPWGSESKWGARVVKRKNASDPSSTSLTFSLTLIHLCDDKVEWDQFWATFTLQVHHDDGEMTSTTSAPLHDFMSIPRLTLANINLPISKPNSPNSTTHADDDDPVLEFKVSLTVFNKNARFYIDLR